MSKKFLPTWSFETKIKQNKFYERSVNSVFCHGKEKQKGFTTATFYSNRIKTAIEHIAKYFLQKQQKKIERDKIN